MVKRRKSKQKTKKIAKKGMDTTYIIGAVALLVVLVSVLGVFKGYFVSMPGKDGPGNSISLQGNQHVSLGESHVAYNSDPPTSGPHYRNIARWGIHDVPVEKELQIHNLEDGGIIIQYNCKDLDPQTCNALTAALTKIVNKYDKTILAPYPNMGNVIALTAWGKIDKFDEFDEERVVRFIGAYIGIDQHGR